VQSKACVRVKLAQAVVEAMPKPAINRSWLQETNQQPVLLVFSFSVEHNAALNSATAHMQQLNSFSNKKNAPIVGMVVTISPSLSL
jgi:hypothetical protein